MVVRVFVFLCVMFVCLANVRSVLIFSENTTEMLPRGGVAGACELSSFLFVSLGMMVVTCVHQ
jgi:hypothetical protein